MSTYRSFDKNNCMYFMIKEEKFLINIIKIWEKVSNIIKKIDSELVYNKKCIKVETKSTQKKAFNVFIYQ